MVLMETEHPEPESVVISVTFFVPAVEYTMPVGFSRFEVAGVAPGPKFHDHITPTLVPVLVKTIGSPVHCGAVDANAATGVA